MNDYEMATPINSLKNNNVSNLVRNVENNLETLKNTNIPSSEPMQLNDPFTYNPNIIPEVKHNQPQQKGGNQVIRNSVPQFHQVPQNINNYNRSIYPTYKQEQPIQEVEVIKEKSVIKKIMVNIKEYLIVILLFSLLAHKKINRLFFNNIPGLNTINTPIPSLILRGTTMALILFAIKKFI